MTRHAVAFTLITLLLLGGCERTSRVPSTVPDTAAQNIAMEREVAGIEQGVRLAAANKRLDELEAEVETLKADQPSADVAALKQRLEAVESSVYAGNVGQPSVNEATAKKAAPSSVGTSSTKPAPIKKSVPATKTAAVIKPATKAEADAFAAGR